MKNRSTPRDYADAPQLALAIRKNATRCNSLQRFDLNEGVECVLRLQPNDGGAARWLQCVHIKYLYMLLIVCVSPIDIKPTSEQYLARGSSTKPPTNTRV